MAENAGLPRTEEVAMGDAISLEVGTERLRLGPFGDGDVDEMHGYQGLEEVARYLYRPPRDRQGCLDAITRSQGVNGFHADGDTILLAVRRRDEAGILGEVSLRTAAAAARQVEIGWVFHPAVQGVGYATEAARSAVGLAFDLGAHRLFARVDVDNLSSVRLCQRLGMRREAHLVENDLTVAGAWGSEYVYAKLAREHPRTA